MEDKKQIRVLAWPPGSPTDQNPYVNMMYSAFTPDKAKIIPFAPLMSRVPDADIFHIQWPESIFEGRGGDSLVLATAKAFRIIATAERLRARGGAVVLTAHNLHPHARMTPLMAMLWRKFHSALLNQLDLIIGLSQTSLRLFLEEHPKARNVETAIIAHPHYCDAYPRADRAAARKRFGASQGTLIGVVGSLRPSKNVLETIKVFREVASETEQLLVAGACEPAYEGALKIAIEDDPRIIFHPQPLSNDQMAEAFAAIDVCLINQSGTLNSGTALLSLSQARPLAAPDVGALGDLYTLFGSKWIQLFKPPLDGDGIREILDNIPLGLENIDDKLVSLSPLKMSTTMLRSFQQLIYRE